MNLSTHNYDLSNNPSLPTDTYVATTLEKVILCLYIYPMFKICIK